MVSYSINSNSHRVNRVLGFFSSRRIGTPQPSPAGEYVPPPPPFGSRGDTLASGRGGGGRAEFGKGDRPWYSMQILCVLCGNSKQLLYIH
jgi:hypothetical protein